LSKDFLSSLNVWINNLSKSNNTSKQHVIFGPSILCYMMYYSMSKGAQVHLFFGLESSNDVDKF